MASRFKKIDDPKQLLLRIARLFSDSSRWTRFAAYRDKNRYMCDRTQAVCFCSIGAIETFAANHTANSKAREALENVIGGQGIVPWNDARGPRGAKVVAAAFRKAAASFA